MPLDMKGRPIDRLGCNVCKKVNIVKVLCDEATCDRTARRTCEGIGCSNLLCEC